MASVAFVRGIEAVINGSVNLGTVTVKALLTTATYAENRTSHTFRSEVTNEVAAGAGYAAGGKNATAAVSHDDATNSVLITFGPVTWTAPSGGTLTARKCVYYASIGSAATDRLLFVNDFVTDRSATNQDLAVLGSTLRFGDIGVLNIDGDTVFMR